MLTLADLLQTEFPSGTAVLAGAAYLDREVSWATMLRARAPGLGNLRGREVALLSASALKALDPTITLAKALEQLQPIVSAVAIRGEVDDAAREQAERLDLPLLQLPQHTDLEALERAIQRSVLDWRQESGHRALQLEREFADLALSGQGFEVLVQTLARRTGKAVALQVPDIEPIVRATRPGGPDTSTLLRAIEITQPHVDAWLRQSDDGGLGRFSTPDQALTRFVAAVRDGRGPVGALSLVAPPPLVSEHDRHALAAAAHACAIELARREARHSALDAVEADIVESFVRAEAADEGAVRARAARMGIDLAYPFAALAFGPDESVPLDALARALQQASTEVTGVCLVRVRTGHVLVLAQLEDDARDDSARAIAQRLSRAPAVRVHPPEPRCGVGLVGRGVFGVQASIVQAEQALGLGRRLPEAERIVSYADLRLFRLLLATAREPSIVTELDLFYQATLGKLLTYDRERGSELVPTLEAFLASLGAPLATAERLHVHRNTLLYRLSRIEAVAGVDLRDPEARLSLHLALRIGQARALMEGEPMSSNASELLSAAAS